MPLFEFKILDEKGNPTEEVIEELFKSSCVPDFLECEDGRIARRTVSLIAKIPGMWGNGGNLNGTFDHGLGCYVEGSQHRDRLMKERGLISASDFSKHAARDNFEKRTAQNNYWDSRNKEFDNLVASGKTEEQAAAEWSSREKCEEDKKWYPKALQSKETKSDI